MTEDKKISAETNREKLYQYELEQSKLVSTAFEKFNKTLLDFRHFQQKLEKQIRDLETELSNKNQELNNILASLPSGLIVANLDYQIIIFNPAAQAITGMSESSAKNSDVNRLLNYKLLPKNLNPKNITENKVDIDYQHPNGKLLNLEATISLMKSKDNNNLEGVIINLQDITLLRSLQQKADQKNRLIAMGQIAASVAHEIRNPLGGMELFVSLLKKDLAANPEHLQAINHLQSAMRSMNHIISNILEFTRPKTVSFSEVNLIETIDEFVEFSALHAKHQSIEIVTEYQKINPTIIANREQLTQLLQNIYMNAAQSMENGGKITISVANYNQDTKLTAKTFFNKQKIVNGILLSIKDQGEGVDLETCQKMFDPFFTTKQKGTGLGLSIVKQIIEVHQGFIAVDSSPGRGSTVHIVLPKETS